MRNFGTINVVPPSEIISNAAGAAKKGKCPAGYWMAWNHKCYPNEKTSNMVDIHSGNEMSKPMYSADGRINEGEDSMSGVMFNDFAGQKGKYSPRFVGKFVPPSARVAPLVSTKIVPIRADRFSPSFEGETEIELSNFNDLDIGATQNIMSEFVGGYNSRADFATNNIASGFGGAEAAAKAGAVPNIFSNAEGEKEETTTTTTTTTTANQGKPVAPSAKPSATAPTESARILGMQRKTAMFVGGALLIGLGVLGYYKFVKK